MWTISELKDRARAAFKANYWTCVGVALIAALVSGGGSCGFNQKVGSGPSSSEVREENHDLIQCSQDAEAEEATPAVLDAGSDSASAAGADAAGFGRFLIDPQQSVVFRARPGNVIPLVVGDVQIYDQG